MKISIDNKFKTLGEQITRKHGTIVFFRVYWQFDWYAKFVEIEIFNFIISIDWKL